jgi:hypothetical protein
VAKTPGGVSLSNTHRPPLASTAVQSGGGGTLLRHEHTTVLQAAPFLPDTLLLPSTRSPLPPPVSTFPLSPYQRPAPHPPAPTPTEANHPYHTV